MKKLLQKITGFSEEVIPHLEIADKNKINLMGGIMIFTSLVSATIMAYAFAVMSFHNLFLIPVIFFIWFIFVYLFERLIISRRKVNRLVMITRFMAAMAFALIHSLIIDVLFFQTDIQESFLNQNKTIAARITKESSAKINAKTKMIHSLMVQNQILTNKIIHLRNKIVSEVDGSSGTHKIGMGPIFDLKKKMFLPEIKALDQNITNNKKSIEDIKNGIEALKSRENNEINKIISPNQHGLLSNIRQLNQIEFVNGDFVSRLFATLFLLVFIFVETLPLFAKLSLDITGYYNILHQAQREREDVAVAHFEHRRITESNKILLSSKISKLKNKIQIKLDEISVIKGSILEKFERLQEIFKLIHDEKENLVQHYPEYEQSHINPLINSIEKDVSQLVKHLNINLS